ncbi:MAG TPA: hypothetical protein VJ890_10885 [Vineibacter sp.]|nr:hypothetical protein [Vineibacter sp.]
MVVTVTDPIFLLPIQTSPLPSNYRFNVQYGSRQIRKESVWIHLASGFGPGRMWPLVDQDVIEPCGFSKLLRGILNHVDLDYLWGQTLQLRANYVQSNGHFVPSTASSPQSLQLPVKPVQVGGGPVDMTEIAAALAALPCVPRSPPQGHRLFWTQLPNASLTHNAWFVGPDNRLAAAADTLAFDRYSFWVSVRGLPIKASMNIQTGEAFAKLIKADRPPPGFAAPQPTVAQIVAAAGSNNSIFYSCIFWNATRLLFYSTSPGFYEYGPNGLSFLSLTQFASGQNQGSPWNVRLYPHAAMAVGQSSVV